MIELKDKEMEAIQANMTYLERDDYDGFFKNIPRYMVSRIRAFMYESLNIDTYDYSKGEITIDTFDNVVPEIYTVPDCVKKIERNTFVYANNLKKLIISDSVEVIEDRAIYSCDNLEEVIFPNNPKYDYIRPGTMSSCNNIKKIWIPDSVTELTAKSVDTHNIKTPGKYMFAHWREDPDKQISIRESDVPIFREHFQFID